MLAKAAFTTLGCKVNQFETETMEGLFKERGYEIVSDDSWADVYVINTCSVTHLGEKKSRQLIRRARRHNPQAILAVTGCYSQLEPDRIKAIEGVSVVVGTNQRRYIVDLVEQAMKENTKLMAVTDVMQERVFEDIPLRDIPKRTRAFLKIQDGCTNFCSYCIIPYTRGPLKSRPLDSVKHEAEKLLRQGFKEIVLTGIHLGAYGRDLAADICLDDAVAALLDFPQLQRLRLGSLESIELTPQLLTMMQSDSRLCQHLHLPLQAGSDEVLQAMNRHYDTAEYKRLLADIWRRVPDAAVSTDIIVGFPGETEELFASCLNFVSQIEFARIHIFPYSRRQGTVAASMDGQIAEMVKKERLHRLQQLADAQTEKFHRRFIGKTAAVLFETAADGEAEGLSGNYIRVYTDASTVKCGEIRQIVLEKCWKDGMWGTLSK